MTWFIHPRRYISARDSCAMPRATTWTLQLEDMHIQVASLVLIATSLPTVLGHGQVHSVITSSGTYAAADAYAAVDPTSPLRKLNTYGPPSDFTGPDITCGVSLGISHSVMQVLTGLRASRVATRQSPLSL